MDMEKLGAYGAKVLAQPEVSATIGALGAAAVPVVADVAITAAVVAAPIVGVGAIAYGIGKMITGE